MALRRCHGGPVVNSVAVLSDVHGVLPVLEAVLAEPEVANADLIVVTGDHASGPQPTEVLDRLVALGERAVLVRGNADRELVALANGQEIDIPDEVTPWAAAQLSPEHAALLDGLPHPVLLDDDRFGQVLFCHGSPGTTKRWSSSIRGSSAGRRCWATWRPR